MNKIDTRKNKDISIIKNSTIKKMKVRVYTENKRMYVDPDHEFIIVSHYLLNTTSALDKNKDGYSTIRFDRIERIGLQIPGTNSINNIYFKDIKVYEYISQTTKKILKKFKSEYPEDFV